MALNVNRDVTDSFYRYKMPRLVAKVEGKGNGIKTVIVNVVEIAKALNRPPMYPTKYFGIELGAQVNHEAKTDRYIVNGSHEASKLQELLDGFIKRFVLCSACSNPETDLNVRKGRIVAKCKACGHSGEIDATHKLCTFILREPPATGKSKSADKEKEKEKDKEKDKEKTAATVSVKDESAKPSVKSEDKEKSTDAHAAEDPDWAGDEASLQAAQRARLAELGRAVRALALDDDAEKPEKERADKLHAFLSDLLAQRLASAGSKAGTLFDAEDEATIVSEVERLELGEKALLILVEVLFTGNGNAPQANGGAVQTPNITTLAKRYSSLLRRVTNGNPKAQSYLLGAFEMLLAQPAHTHEQRLLPNVLMCLYEADALEEDAILEWNKHPRKFVTREQAAVLRRSAAPFIEWLEKAEEEESDEEESDDEDGSATGGVNGSMSMSMTMQSAATAVDAQKPDEPEEEINIDDI